MMPETLDLTWEDVRLRACEVGGHITKLVGHAPNGVYFYPVPRGGIYAALAIQAAIEDRLVSFITEDRSKADFYIDDIIDTGRTRESVSQFNNGIIPFIALVDKQQENLLGTWVSFPWERMANETGPEDAVTRILQFIGEDPKREGLLETPARVVRSYAELFAGYKQDPKSIFRVFEDGACDQMVILKDIEFVSFCEHHMLPFVGRAHIAYIPRGKVIGVSKLARLLEIYARRLQIQERICQQITNDLDTHLNPQGSACIIEAKHLCMTCRGIGKQHSSMITSSVTGAFRDKPEARMELMQFIGQ